MKNLRFQIRIWTMDGFDLYWRDYEDDESGGLDLSFDTYEDAYWAQQVWMNFVYGNIERTVKEGVK